MQFRKIVRNVISVVFAVALLIAAPNAFALNCNDPDDPKDKELFEQLADKNPFERRRAVEYLALKGCDDPKSIGALINALKDNHEEVRSHAASVLSLPSLLKKPQVVPPLITAMQEDASNTIKAYAAESLGKTGDRRAVAPLIKMLSHKDIDVKIAVILALGKIKDASAIDSLIEAKDNSHVFVKFAVSDALEAFVDPKAKKALATFSEYSKKNRLKKLGELTTSKVLDLRKRAFRELSDRIMRLVIHRARGKKKDHKQELSLLVTGLNDSNSTIRSHVIRSLSLTRDKQVVPYLIKALEDRSFNVRKDAVWSLRYFKADGRVKKALDAYNSSKKKCSKIIPNYKIRELTSDYNVWQCLKLYMGRYKGCVKVSNISCTRGEAK